VEINVIRVRCYSNQMITFSAEYGLWIQIRISDGALIIFSVNEHAHKQTQMHATCINRDRSNMKAPKDAERQRRKYRHRVHTYSHTYSHTVMFKWFHGSSMMITCFKKFNLIEYIDERFFIDRLVLTPFRFWTLMYFLLSLFFLLWPNVISNGSFSSYDRI